MMKTGESNTLIEASDGKLKMPEQSAARKADCAKIPGKGLNKTQRIRNQSATKKKYASHNRKKRDIKVVVEEIYDKIVRHTHEHNELVMKGDTKNALKKKNIIAAYESKVGKHITLAYYESSANIRQNQLSSIFKVLKRELSAEKLDRIKRCIQEETPAADTLSDLF